MEKTQREFQAEFFRLSKGVERVYVYGRGRRLVGIWTPAIFENAVQDDLVEADEEKEDIAVQPKPNAVQVFEDLKKEYDTRTGEIYDEEEAEEVEEEVKVCMKCRRSKVEGTYVEHDWESGDEREIELCRKCGTNMQKKH